MKPATDGRVGVENDGGGASGASRRKISDWPWAVIASVFGLVMAGIAYSLGDAYHNAYLGGFAVHSGAFPADHPTHFVFAVWGGLHATIALQQWLVAHVLRLVGAIAACLIYFAALPVIFAVISPFIANSRGHAEGARTLLAKRPLLQKYVRTVMAIMFFLLSALWIFLFVPPAISIPSAIGEAVGNDVAKLDQKDFDRGCDQSMAKCYQAVRNGKEFARGYIIAQSPDRAALYYMGNTSQFPLGDVTLRTLDTAQSPAKP